MPYQQAYDLLKSENPTLEQLLDAYLDIGFQHGYVAAVATHGLRDNVESELIRFIVILEALKFKILEKVN